MEDALGELLRTLIALSDTQSIIRASSPLYSFPAPPLPSSLLPSLASQRVAAPPPIGTPLQIPHDAEHQLITDITLTPAATTRFATPSSTHNGTGGGTSSPTIAASPLLLNTPIVAAAASDAGDPNDLSVINNNNNNGNDGNDGNNGNPNNYGDASLLMDGLHVVPRGPSLLSSASSLPLIGGHIRLPSALPFFSPATVAYLLTRIGEVTATLSSMYRVLHHTPPACQQKAHEPGGFHCLLRIISDRMRETQKLLAEINHEFCNPPSSVISTRDIWLLWHRFQWVTWLSLPIPIIHRFTTLYGRFAPRSSYIIPLLSVIGWYRCRPHTRVEAYRHRLGKMHRQLQSALTIMVFCIDMITVGEGVSVAEFDELRIKSVHGSALETTYLDLRSLVVRSPPNMEASFWYTRDYRMWMFRHCMCALYTALGKAHAVLRAQSGGRGVNKTILRAATCAMTPYYFFQPKKALAESYRLLSESPNSSTDFLRCCWNLFEGSWILGGMNWLTLPRMTINRERIFKLPGLPSVRCVLLSARPLPHDHPLVVLFGAKGSSAHYDRMLSSSFIFHIHGGGYIADMESLDKPVLTRWAVEVGVPIVSVHYALAPEQRFPVALEQCFGMYRMILEAYGCGDAVSIPQSYASTLSNTPPSAVDHKQRPLTNITTPSAPAAAAAATATSNNGGISSFIPFSSLLATPTPARPLPPSVVAIDGPLSSVQRSAASSSSRASPSSFLNNSSRSAAVPRIALVGDSAGGNICCSLTLRIIQHNIYNQHMLTYPNEPVTSMPLSLRSPFSVLPPSSARVENGPSVSASGSKKYGNNSSSAHNASSDAPLSAPRPYHHQNGRVMPSPLPFPSLLSPPLPSQPSPSVPLQSSSSLMSPSPSSSRGGISGQEGRRSVRFALDDDDLASADDSTNNSVNMSREHKHDNNGHMNGVAAVRSGEASPVYSSSRTIVEGGSAEPGGSHSNSNGSHTDMRKRRQSRGADLLTIHDNDDEHDIEDNKQHDHHHNDNEHEDHEHDEDGQQSVSIDEGIEIEGSPSPSPSPIPPSSRASPLPPVAAPIPAVPVDDDEPQETGEMEARARFAKRTAAASLASPAPNGSFLAPPPSSVPVSRDAVDGKRSLPMVITPARPSIASDPIVTPHGAPAHGSNGVMGHGELGPLPSRGAYLPLPAGVVLAYPVVNATSTVSPSRLVHMGDPLLRFNLLMALTNVYLGDNVDERVAYSNMFISPVLAPSHLLSQFPATHIVAAEIDAFLDDSVDMHHRLRRLGVTSSLHVCPHTPHGFLGMGKIFAEAEKGIQLVTSHLRAVVL